jgi:N-acetylneuraminic acid mutarotase
MRTISLAAALALLLAGCGLDLGPAEPEVSEVPLPGPALDLLESDAAAVSTTNLWAGKAPVPTARAFFAAGVVNRVLYAVGGSDNDGYVLRTVQAYDPGANTWVPKAPLPSGRVYLNGAGTINGVLYVAGGLDTNGRVTSDLFAYTPSTNTWTGKQPMLAGGASGATGVIGGKLYVYSTTTGARTFQRYDPATNTWAYMALPARNSLAPVAGVIDGKFYLVGGIEYNQSVSDRVEVYDPASNSWTLLPSIPTARYGAGSAVIDGLLYVVGGSHS